MLETAWESRWVPDSFEKITRKSVLYRTDTFQWAEGKAKPVLKNVLTWFSRAVLFYIAGFYQWSVSLSWSSFRMTDKLQSQWCGYEGALRKADAFLSHGVPRLYNHIKNCLWTQVFNTVFHMIVHASGYIAHVPWKPHIEIYLDRVFIRQSIKTTSRHPRCYILWCNQTKLVKVTVTYGEITNLRPEIQRYVS